MRYSTISAIGGFTALSSSSADYLFLDPSSCTGGSDAPLRTTVEPAPGLDGVLVFPPLNDAQVLTLAGVLRITSAVTESGYISALDTLLASLKTALDALKTAPGNLVHSGGTLKVWKYAPLESAWSQAQMSVTFGLVVDVFA